MTTDEIRALNGVVLPLDIYDIINSVLPADNKEVVSMQINTSVGMVNFSLSSKDLETLQENFNNVAYQAC